ncbi:Lar family restriction alleviation protein [Stenotrophomonas terrae]|uniref:Lar family restriction alleviation protein n=1 Tax=Stenotrophomonas terrae TaxID=405446 RepID=UPI003207A846
MDDQQRARELKPCPFCGSADSEMQQAQAEHYVQCLECEASTALLSSRREARELWNRRAALRAAPEWQPIDTAPKDDRVLVRCESGSVYAAHWVQNPMTGDEAWLVCALEDGTQMLVHPVEWMPLPDAARPQGVKDAG